jgi:hypothetical protein
MENQFEFTGTVLSVSKTETVGEKDFKKRTIVLTDDKAKYYQEIPFDFVQDNVGKLDAVSVGDKVTVSFNLRSRLWNGKWYVTLYGWRIEKIVSEQAPAKQYAEIEIPAKITDDRDDLPF